MIKKHDLRDCIKIECDIYEVVSGFGAYVRCIRKNEVILEVNTMWRLGSLDLETLEEKLESFETFQQVKKELDI